MPVETSSLFAQVIQDHLELKRKNSELEGKMPISGYMAEDPFENHPLFKTEEQARVEDTMSGQESILQESTSLDWPAAEDTFIAAPEPVPADTAAEPSLESPPEPSSEPFDGEALDAGILDGLPVEGASLNGAPADAATDDAAPSDVDVEPSVDSEAPPDQPLPEPDAESEEGLWTRSRDFDWGD